MDAAIAKQSTEEWSAAGAYYAQPTPEQMALLRTHPCFSEAVWRMAETPVEALPSGRLAIFILNDRVRTQIGYFILYLYWWAQQQNGQHGLTASQVKSVFTEMKFASAGRVDALLAAMRLFGYVRLEPDPYDKRVKLIVPTERHVAAFLQMLQIQLAAMATVMEEGRVGLANLERKGFMPAFIRKVCESRYHGFRLVNSVPEIKSFFNYHAATPILLYMMINGHKTDAQTVETAISVSRLSKQFQVSRAHVRKVLAEAEAAGFIARPVTDNLPTIMLPAWMDTIERLYAAIFLHFAACIRSALEDIDNGSGEFPLVVSPRPAIA
jgi:DNA-binding MarR family transcriptional regulator